MKRAPVVPYERRVATLVLLLRFVLAYYERRRVPHRAVNDNL